MKKSEKDLSFEAVFLSIFLAVTGAKLLLIPTYHSTDFEVHRNWLAITHTLPVSKWYYENTSIWTLDYPPFFAWFEYGMSHLAAKVDPEIVRLENLNYDAPSVVIFQRLTVIVSEFVLIGAVYVFAKSEYKAEAPGKAWAISLLTLLSPGLFIVDHIHFQYNGFLFGILFWSIIAFQRGHFLTSAFLFASLLNFKHIFLYCAPAYGMALLKFHCFSELLPSGRVKMASFSFAKFISLGILTLSVFAVSLGPFINHLPQLLSRLFPFQRGLMHAYWAPNAWALYAILDKIAVQLCQRFLGLKFESVGALTGGLVGSGQEFTVLPQISPRVTFLATISALIPGLVLFWVKSKNRQDLVRLVVFSSLVSFFFGWHVHEKAICMVLLPFGLFFAVSSNPKDFRSFGLLSLAGYYSLFPLLFNLAEYPIKVAILLIFIVAIYTCGQWIKVSRPFGGSSLLFGIMLSIVVAIEVFPVAAKAIHERLPFLQLMATSICCAVFIFIGSLTFFSAMVEAFSVDSETAKTVTSAGPVTRSRKTK